MPRMMRRAVRRSARRHVRRRMRRRMVLVGGMVVLAASGTAAAVKLSKEDAASIQEYSGIPVEEMEDEDLATTMNELGIQSAPLDANDQASISGAPVPSGTPAAPAAASGTSVADELVKLDELRKQGILSDAEFEAGKNKLLGI